MLEIIVEKIETAKQELENKIQDYNKQATASENLDITTSYDFLNFSDNYFAPYYPQKKSVVTVIATVKNSPTEY